MKGGSGCGIRVSRVQRFRGGEGCKSKLLVNGSDSLFIKGRG